MRPEFCVQPGGLERVRKEQRKNVHAFIRGKTVEAPDDPGRPQSVYYNPYLYSTFVTSSGLPFMVLAADYAQIICDENTPHSVNLYGSVTLGPYQAPLCPHCMEEAVASPLHHRGQDGHEHLWMCGTCEHEFRSKKGATRFEEVPRTTEAK